MKLFVDDQREAPEGWHLCRSVTQAIRAIATCPEPISEISLDHDIGCRDEDHPDGYDQTKRCHYPETFEPVARFIVAYYESLYYPENLDPPTPPKIIIHTGNPAAAKRMADILNGFKVEIKPRI